MNPELHFVCIFGIVPEVPASLVFTMALLQESLGETHDTPLSRTRVVPDLVHKLPGLYGEGAPDNTLKTILTGNSAVRFFPLNTHYPMDYVGLYSTTGLRLDHIYQNVHDYFHGGGWTARVGAQLDAMPNFQLGWEGHPDHAESKLFRIHWIGHTPSLTFDTAERMVCAELFQDRYIEPIPFAELPTARGISWLATVFGRSAVKFEDLLVQPENNTVAATLVAQREKQTPFRFVLPLVLHTHLVDGVQSRLGKRFVQQAQAG